jgi:hypothetical protein
MHTAADRPLDPALGPLEKVYTYSHRADALSLVIAALLCTMLAVSGYSLFVQPIEGLSTLLAWLLTGMGVVFLGVLIYFRIISRSLRVHLHQNGFVYSRIGLSHKVLWDDIAELWRVEIPVEAGAVPTGSLAQLRLVHKNGHLVLLLDSLHRVGELGDRIEDAIYPRLLAEAKEQLAKGQPVRFGPITLDDKALAGESWEQLISVGVHQGITYLLRKDDREIGIHVPNTRVLMALAEARMPSPMPPSRRSLQ